jgi:putative ABC transport system permease protein
VLATERQFTAVAVIVLAFGIGATAAVFSIVNTVLLRPLPYQDPGRLVAISSVLESSAAARTSTVVPLTDLAEWRSRSRMFSSMGAFAYTQLPMQVGNQSFSPVTALMDPPFLPTLGNPLAMGTYFAETPESGSDMTAILGHALWVEALASNPSAIGRTIVVDGAPYVVRGVLAADFQFPRSDASYFTKSVGLLLPSSSFEAPPPQSRQWFGIARLAPGVTMTQAEEELRSVAEGLSRDVPTGDGWSVRLTRLGEATTRRARQPLLIVLGISMVLLLIAATNLMNLFFSRGVARLREMSIRRAIGSTTGRLVRQLLIEGVALAMLGGSALAFCSRPLPSTASSRCPPCTCQ